MNEITIKTFIYPEAFTEMRAIRTTVFHKEQRVDQALEFDGLDNIAEHLLAYLDNQPVGTARIRYLDSQTAKIERLAVLPIARGKGIGKKLMEKALDMAEQKSRQQVVVNAQEYVKGLYQQLGFEEVGEKFDEAGIPHVKMLKKIR